jgi:PAS domain S-box-containing protein
MTSRRGLISSVFGRRPKHATESEGRDRSMLESMPDLVLQLNEDGEYVGLHASEVAKPLLRRGGEIHDSVEDSFPPDIAERWRRGLKETLKTGSIQTIEYQIEDSQGVNHFEVRFVPAGRNKATSIIRDITRRKLAEAALQESEHRYRSLVEAFHDIVFLADYAGNLIYANPSFERQTGHIVTDVKLLSERQSLVHPEDRVQVRRFTDDFADGEHRYSGVIEHRLVDKGGNTRWYSTAISKVTYRGQPALQYIAHDITDHVRAEQALRSSRRQLELLSRRLIQVQETERSQIARELHDQLGQELTAVKLNLETVAQSVQDAPTRQRVEESIAIVGELMAETRNLALELRPPVLDDLGLTAALRWYTERQSERGGIEANFSGPDFAERPPKDIESACFRIGQAASTNVLRHANAGRMDVRLATSDGELVLTVQDDGVGFEVDPATDDTTDRESMGTFGMQERASLVGGTMSIESSIGEGTTVQARFPLRTGR